MSSQSWYKNVFHDNKIGIDQMVFDSTKKGIGPKHFVQETLIYLRPRTKCKMGLHNIIRRLSINGR